MQRISPLVIAELFSDRAGGHVITSNFPWYSTLIFEEATKWLPAHRQIWELAPLLLALLSIALMSWSALRVAGRWAAALTAVILLCAGPAVLELMFWLTDHTPTWYSPALLAAFLVLLTDSRLSIGWLPLTVITLFIGAVVGIDLATDKELFAGGTAAAAGRGDRDSGGESDGSGHQSHVVCGRPGGCDRSQRDIDGVDHAARRESSPTGSQWALRALKPSPRTLRCGGSRSRSWGTGASLVKRSRS